jgi:hypothetical protein
MLATIAAILVVLWLALFVLKIAGGLVHIIIVVALILFAVHFIRGRAS